MNWTKLFTGGRLMHDKRSRNRYPKALIEMVEGQFGFTKGMLGADAGCGSGRLTALFLEHGYNIVAVEPDASKRNACERLRGRWDHLKILNGTPDATGLETASVDFVTSPRAIYEPDQAAVRHEFRRILRPGGYVVLITDNRVYGGASQSEAYDDLLRTYCANFRERRMPYDIAGAVANFFDGGEVYEDAFVGSQMLSLEALIAQTQALPICPPVEDAQYQPMMDALRDYFSLWAVDGALVVPTVCRVACGRFDK